MARDEDTTRAGSEVDMPSRIEMDRHVAAMISESHVASCRTRKSSMSDSRSAHRCCRSWGDSGVEIAMMMMVVVVVVVVVVLEGRGGGGGGRMLRSVEM